MCHDRQSAVAMKEKLCTTTWQITSMTFVFLFTLSVEFSQDRWVLEKGM